MPYQDDLTISDDTTLWRRIPPAWVVYDENQGRSRPSSQAFQDDRNEEPMSVYLADECDGHDEALAGHEGFFLVSVTAEQVRSLGQGIARDPLPDAPSHCLVFGKKTKKVRSSLAKRADWVVAPHHANPA